MTPVKRYVVPLPEGAGQPAHVVQQMGRLMQATRDLLAEEDLGGLRQSHIRMLALIPPQGITISDLAGPMHMTKQAAGQFVAQLAAWGQLEVRSDPADRRLRLVFLTASGARTYGEAARRIARMERSWARKVGARDYAEFRRVLDALVDSV